MTTADISIQLLTRFSYYTCLPCISLLTVYAFYLQRYVYVAFKLMQNIMLMQINLCENPWWKRFF